MRDGHVIEAWTGPQVAWGMARGRVGSFGGKVLNAWWMWTALSVVFFLGLVDRRRIRSWHTARPAGARCPSGSRCWFFNRGRRLHERVARGAAARVPRRPHVVDRLPRPPLRTRRSRGPSGCSRRSPSSSAACGSGSTSRTPRGVIDVGYAGVIGADRILDGQAPYGHMPVDDTRAAPAARPTPTERSATASRRTAAASPPTLAATPTGRPPTSSTSRPCSPSSGPASGTRCRPPTRRRSPSTCSSSSASSSSVAASAGTPLGVGARLRLARVPLHRLRDELQLERHDHARDPRLGVLALRPRPSSRGAPMALAGWTKFAALLLAPLWLTYPNGLRPPQRAAVRARVRRSRRWPCSRSCCSSRASTTAVHVLRRPHARLPARPRLAVLALGLGPVPRARDPRTSPPCRWSSRSASSRSQASSRRSRCARARSSSPR